MFHLVCFLLPISDGLLKLLNLHIEIRNQGKEIELVIKTLTSCFLCSYSSTMPGLVFKFISRLARCVSSSACSSSTVRKSTPEGSGSGSPCVLANCNSFSYVNRTFSIAVYSFWISSEAATRPCLLLSKIDFDSALIFSKVLFT
jgi:hypothetical protein